MSYRESEFQKQDMTDMLNFSDERGSLQLDKKEGDNMDHGARSRKRQS